jgi:hypothetical protein
MLSYVLSVAHLNNLNQYMKRKIHFGQTIGILSRDPVPMKSHTKPIGSSELNATGCTEVVKVTQ